MRARLQVLFGVPKGREAEADALSSSISDKLRGVLGAIDAKCARMPALAPAVHGDVKHAATVVGAPQQVLAEACEASNLLAYGQFRSSSGWEYHRVHHHRLLRLE